MREEKIQARIKLGRSFVVKFLDMEGVDEDYQSDQDMKKPQPPLVKAPMTDTFIDLPTDFGNLSIDGDFLHVINTRRSHRVYTEEKMSLLELSYLLWCTQGVKRIRGKAYATIRTVPSGGARHPFECYMVTRNVEGLEDGLYHYLPMTHQIERLPSADVSDQLADKIAESLCDQNWALKANIIFFYSCVFYRAEWRYGIWAHAPVLIDSGHVTENLYLAATSIGRGGCAIAAVEPLIANQIFGLDGVEETIFYAMPVGTVREENKNKEDAFYAFLKEDNL